MVRIEVYRFVCGYCGQLTSSPHSILKCQICQKPLCNKSHRVGLCPEHYGYLTTEEQKILSSGHKSDIIGCGLGMVSCFPIMFGLLFIMIGAIMGESIGGGIVLFVIGVSVAWGFHH